MKRDHKEEFKQLIAPPKYGHIDETEIHNGNSQLLAFDDLIENDFNDIQPTKKASDNVVRSQLSRPKESMTIPITRHDSSQKSVHNTYQSPNLQSRSTFRKADQEEDEAFD